MGLIGNHIQESPLLKNISQKLTLAIKPGCSSYRGVYETRFEIVKSS